MIHLIEPKVLQSKKSSLSSKIPTSLLLTIEIPPFPYPNLREFYEIRTLTRFIPDHVFGSLQAHFIVDCPDNLRSLIEDYLSENDTHDSKEVTSGLRNHLTNKGFTFAQVKVSKGGANTWLP